uniref:Uncharacterized protein n=1 Tax=Nelumbo nucifera TaxID=4432 RepID=A0A822ZRT6_NELNU|nr:TPA_asm: hypothetical protein HUJ06_002778 [Nelumbo nucifera]
MSSLEYKGQETGVVKQKVHGSLVSRPDGEMDRLDLLERRKKLKKKGEKGV